MVFSFCLSFSFLFLFFEVFLSTIAATAPVIGANTLHLCDTLDGICTMSSPFASVFFSIFLARFHVLAACSLVGGSLVGV